MRATVVQAATASPQATIVDKRNGRFSDPVDRTLSIIRPTWSSYGLKVELIRRQESLDTNWARAVSTYERPWSQKGAKPSFIASVHPTGDQAVDGRARLAQA